MQTGSPYQRGLIEECIQNTTAQLPMMIDRIDILKYGLFLQLVTPTCWQVGMVWMHRALRKAIYSAICCSIAPSAISAYHHVHFYWELLLFTFNIQYCYPVLFTSIIFLLLSANNILFKLLRHPSRPCAPL